MNLVYGIYYYFIQNFTFIVTHFGDNMCCISNVLLRLINHFYIYQFLFQRLKCEENRQTCFLIYDKCSYFYYLRKPWYCNHFFLLKLGYEPVDVQIFKLVLELWLFFIFLARELSIGNNEVVRGQKSNVQSWDHWQHV